MFLLSLGEPEWDAVNNEGQKSQKDAELDTLIAQANTKDSKLHRTNIFPPALYPYLVVGICCHKEYTFTRQVVNVNNPSPLSATPFKIPLEVPADMLEKKQVDTFGRATTFPFLRGIKDSKEFEVIDPLKYDKKREFNLGQDPCLVLANVGEFLHVTRERLEQDGENFQMANFVDDKVHREHLRLTLDIFTQWKTNDSLILDIEKSLKKRAKDKAGGRSRKSGKASTHSYNTRSRTSEVAKGLLDNFRPGFDIDSHSRDHVSIRDSDPPSPTPSSRYASNLP